MNTDDEQSESIKSNLRNHVISRIGGGAGRRPENRNDSGQPSGAGVVEFFSALAGNNSGALFKIAHGLWALKK